MKRFARVKTDPDTGMNKTETEYAALLEARRRTGEIIRWRFEPVRFVLGKGSVYTPDFEVVLPDGTLEYHETKGHWREAAKVRIKVAATKFNDRRFVAIVKRAKKLGGGWTTQEFN